MHLNGPLKWGDRDGWERATVEIGPPPTQEIEHIKSFLCNSIMSYRELFQILGIRGELYMYCLLYTSDAADE